MRGYDSKTIYGGVGTLNASRSPMLLNEMDLVDVDNVTYERDTWEKVGGADKINGVSVGGTRITGQHEWIDDSGNVEVIVSTADGRLLVIDDSGIVKTLATGLGSNRVGVFSEGSVALQRRLFFVNGSSPMRVYDGGATADPIGEPAADWTAKPPTWLALHEGRMFVGNDTDFIYASVLNEHDDYTSAGSAFFNVYPGEGHGVVGAISKWTRLFLFKFPLGVYYLDDADPDFVNWRVRRHGRNVGCVGHRSIVEAIDDVLFVSPQGYFHALSAVQEFGDVMTSAILPLELGPFMRDNIDFTRARQIQSYHYATKRKVYWAFTRRGFDVNNIIVGLDFHNPNKVQGFVSRRDICESLGPFTDQQSNLEHPAAGDDNGFLWKLETATYDKDGVAYTGQWETDDIALYPDGMRRANLRELEIVFDQVGNWNVNMDVIVDGAIREALTFSLQGAGAVLGSFILGQDVLGILALQNTRARLHGDGRRVKLRGHNGLLGESFRIVSQRITYLPGTDR